MQALNKEGETLLLRVSTLGEEILKGTLTEEETSRYKNICMRAFGYLGVMPQSIQDEDFLNGLLEKAISFATPDTKESNYLIYKLITCLDLDNTSASHSRNVATYIRYLDRLTNPVFFLTEAQYALGRLVSDVKAFSKDVKLPIMDPLFGTPVDESDPAIAVQALAIRKMHEIFKMAQKRNITFEKLLLKDPRSQIDIASSFTEIHPIELQMILDNPEQYIQENLYSPF